MDDLPLIFPLFIILVFSVVFLVCFYVCIRFVWITLRMPFPDMLLRITALFRYSFFVFALVTFFMANNFRIFPTVGFTILKTWKFAVQLKLSLKQS
ncbi:unnamed protein product [Clavelina lepadiformis]|uniref:ATP synthase F0 subunit 8 n=1 Tax=Clavelina lepadiformis TaxID=159417 RepID=A0ABP0FNX9_CLALP